MSLPLRTVTEEEYKIAAAKVEAIKAKFSKEHPMTMADLVPAFDPQGDVLRWHLQQTTKEYAFKCHIIRIGEIAIATNPFELFHEFGMRMKARTCARQLFIVQLANGLGGYLPTELAVKGGSYSSKAASTTCGPEGGTVLVN
ncbi:MAG: hypothetical protein MJ099_04485, partial [Clostridia bacterium]|nr:hypothetical protein [Clostridia bacterium]